MATKSNNKLSSKTTSTGKLSKAPSELSNSFIMRGSEAKLSVPLQSSKAVSISSVSSGRKSTKQINSTSTSSISKATSSNQLLSSASKTKKGISKPTIIKSSEIQEDRVVSVSNEVLKEPPQENSKLVKQKDLISINITESVPTNNNNTTSRRESVVSATSPGKKSRSPSLAAETSDISAFNSSINRASSQRASRRPSRVSSSKPGNPDISPALTAALKEIERISYPITPLQKSLMHYGLCTINTFLLKDGEGLVKLCDAVEKLKIMFPVLKMKYDPTSSTFLDDSNGLITINLETKMISKWQDVEANDFSELNRYNIVISNFYFQDRYYVSIISPTFILDDTSSELLCYALKCFIHNEEFELKESIDFPTYAKKITEDYDEEDAMIYAMDQLVIKEIPPLTVDKPQTEAEVKRRKIYCNQYLESMKQIQKQKSSLQKTLEEERKERLNIEKETGNESGLEFVDTVTGQLITIPANAKQALFRSVLGDEAVSENISSLLNKHDISKQAMESIHASEITLDKFLTFDTSFFNNIRALTPKERKKLIALAEYCRNRVKESADELKSIKGIIERKIQKLEREIEKLDQEFLERQNNYDMEERQIVQLEQLINPSKIIIFVEPASLASLGAEISGSAIDVNASGVLSITNPIKVNEGSSTFNTRYASRKFKITKSQILPMYQIAEHYGFLSDDKEEVIKCILISCFAILIKHVIGKERFLLGMFCRASDDQANPTIGCSSTLLPLKIDFGSAQFFSDICDAVAEANVTRKAERLNITWESLMKKASEKYQSISMNSNELMILFDFRKSNVSKKLKDFYSSCQRIQTTYCYHLKFEVNCYGEDDLEATLFYDSKIISDAKVEKWLQRLITLIDSFYLHGRSSSVSRLIGRFYQNIWTSTEQLGSSSQKGDF